MTQLTELEGAVLNTIARSQPMTAYAVRSKFQGSLTTSWNASAGSIYPLVRKLLKAELINEAKQSGDKRGTKMLEITSAGKSALRDWLTRIDDTIASPVADPIRTRSYYLESLSPTEQKRLVKEWQRLTRDVIKRTAESMQHSETINNHLELRALQASKFQVAARLKWLNELARDL